MVSCREATEEGVNGLFAEQAAEAGGATVSLYQFDDRYDTVFEHLPIDQAPAYRLQPRGRTALLDAVGHAFTREGYWMATLPEHERPGKVIAVVATDGRENSSREYTAAQIRTMIQHQREVYSWEVVFIGADLDSVRTAEAYGIPRSGAMRYSASPAGTSRSYRSLSSMLSRGARGGDYGFNEAERAQAVDDSPLAGASGPAPSAPASPPTQQAPATPAPPAAAPASPPTQQPPAAPAASTPTSAPVEPPARRSSMTPPPRPGMQPPRR